jgi:hypothetical protein
MFKLFNAAIGVAMAFWLYSPQGFIAWAQTPGLQTLRVQIAAEHPRRKLVAQMSGALQALER